MRIAFVAVLSFFLACVIPATAGAQVQVARDGYSCQFQFSMAPSITVRTGYAIVPAAGGAITLTAEVTVIGGPPDASCPWGLSTSDGWITTPTAQFNGSRSVIFNVSANSSRFRNGHLRVDFGGGFSSTLDIGQGIPIGCGEYRSGSMTDAEEVHAFDFSAAPSDVPITKAIDGVSGFTLPADRVQLSAYHVGDPTTYSIIVKKPDSAQYSVGLQFSKGGTCATTVTCGGAMSGTLPNRAKMDAYRFSGTAGDVIAPFVRYVYSSSISATIYAPDGYRPLVTGTLSPTFTVVLPDTGVYTVIITGDSLTYDFAFQFTKGGSCAATGLACGDVAQGIASVAPKLDRYSFSGSAGDKVILPPFLVSRWLYDPQGQHVARDVPASAESPYTLPSAGTYTILVEPSGRASVGTYTIGLQSVSGACATAITCGQTIVTPTTALRADAFTFAGTAGASVSLFAPQGNTSTSIGEIVELYAPDSTRVTAGTRFATGFLIDQLPVTGAYTAIVMNSVVGSSRRFGLACRDVCAPMVWPLSATFDSSGGRGDIGVITGAPVGGPDDRCCWTTQSNVPWIRFISGGAACRSWAPAYEVDPFAGPGSRSGTMTVAGQTFTVSQTSTNTAAPQNLAVTVNGSQITLTWLPPAAGAPLNYLIEVGTVAGATNVTLSAPGTATTYVISDAPAGTFYIRLRSLTPYASGPSNEVIATVGASATTPGAPRALAASVSDHVVTLAWQAPATGGVVSTYLIEAGSATGLANLATVPTNGISTQFAASAVPDGVYIVRVKAANAWGAGPPSNEVSLRVGAVPCTSAPAPPAGLQYSLAGRQVTLSWTATSDSNAPQSSTIEVGSAPGLSDIVVFDYNSTATTMTVLAPPGTYFVRIRGGNSCGRSSASSEIVVTVP